MIQLTSEDKELHCNQKVCYICKKGFSNHGDNKKYHQFRDHCHCTGKYRGAAHDICDLRHKTPTEFPVVFHNGSTYDYHFIIKNLAEEFNGPFECLWENTEKYKTFSILMNKEFYHDKTITYKIRWFIGSFRFMSGSLPNLVDNLPEGLCNYEFIECVSCLDYTITKDN